jgi:hypothetical protein
MSIYYNETTMRLSPTLRVGSSCDQAVDGMLGIKPKPSQATYSSPSFAMRQCAHAHAYGPLQSPGFLRKTRRLGARWDSGGRTARCCCPETAWPLFGLDIWLPLSVCEYGTHEQTWRLTRGGRHPNTATCLPDPVLDQYGFHRRGTCDQPSDSRFGASSDTAPYIFLSSISYESEKRDLVRCRTQYSVA